MFEGFSQKTIDFMWNIRLNNNKAWFEEHKSEYQSDLQQPLKELGSVVFNSISQKYPQHGFIHKVSRIYKDARRLHGGDPYKDHLWFSIEKPSDFWTATPVFWFEISPEIFSYGLGYYSAKAETMAKMRARIDKNPAKFEKLILPLSKQNEFVLEGAEYVRTKISPTPNTAQWYNKKSFTLVHQQENSNELFSHELAQKLIESYEFLMPIYDYFITIDSDPATK